MISSTYLIIDDALIDRYSRADAGVSVTEQSFDVVAEVINSHQHEIVDCACILVDLQDTTSALAVLRSIRQNTDPRIYLRHVVLICDESSLNARESLASHGFDLILHGKDSPTLNSQEPKWVATENWINKIPKIKDGLQDTSLRFKLLRFIVSRQLHLSPIKTIYDKRGFVFPLLAPFVEDDQESIAHILSFLNQQQLLASSFIEKSHSCGSCGSAFLNFKETCPDCRSSNIAKDQLLHHFSCGTIDSQEKFRMTGRLVCPKCDKELRHIGVDYDKPSSINRCNSCSLHFQEPHVETQCFACGRTSEIQDLVLHDIQSYEATSIGRNAAIFGLDALFTQILQIDLQLYSHSEVKNYLKIEKARIQRYQKSNTTLGCLYFTNLEQVYDRLGKKTEQLFKEISAVFKSVFRESDIITARNESVFAVVMTETDQAGCELAMQRLEQAITSLFDESLDFQLQLKTACYNVNDVDDLDNVIDTLISDKD